MDLRGDQNWLLSPSRGEKGVPIVGLLGLLLQAAGGLGVAESTWSEGVPKEGQPSVTYQSPGRSEDIPAGLRTGGNKRLVGRTSDKSHELTYQGQGS